MSQKPATRDELHCAKMDRFDALNQRLMRVYLRAALVAAADKNASHKHAYKIHGAARRIKVLS